MPDTGSRVLHNRQLAGDRFTGCIALRTTRLRSLDKLGPDSDDNHSA
ncbi:hypothetical protein AB0H49_13835 [Nocardia sp. NPDC050713]